MALSAAAAAAIAAGASALGSVGSAGVASARNMKIAKYSAEFQREMINEQNRYNSPLEQMKRYQEAGLNPSLIYGDGASSTGNQSNIARYDTPDLPTPDIGPVLGQLLEMSLRFRQMNADLALKEQELENKKEEQFNIRSTRLGQDIDNAYKSVITGFDPGLVMSIGDRDSILKGVQLKKYNAELASVEQMNALHKAQKGLVDAQITLTGYKADAQKYYYENIQPLVKETMDKTVAGLEIKNNILEIEKEFARFDKYFGYGTKLFDAIMGVINPLKNISKGIHSGNIYDGYDVSY